MRGAHARESAGFMGKLELTQAAGAIVGAVAGMLLARRFGGAAAFAGLFVGGIAGMLLATGLFVLIFWLVTKQR